MLKLKEVKIAKNKSYLETQVVSIEDKITTLVGKMNQAKLHFLKQLQNSTTLKKTRNFNLM